MKERIILSKDFPQTWIFDLDGTLVKHNGYLIDGEDTLLDGVQDFFENLSPNDYVLILTARSSKYKEQTLHFLKQNNVRYNQIIFDMPKGERILINDIKPKGLKCSIAINTTRDKFLETVFVKDKKMQ